MTQKEFEAWVEFYRAYPFDDRHRYHRPAALVAGKLGGDVQKHLDWLSPEPSLEGLSDADITTLRTLGFDRKGD